MTNQFLQLLMLLREDEVISSEFLCASIMNIFTT